MNILVCVKRVPATGGRIVLTADERDIDTRFLGFVVSPHEECAVEEAVRLVEAHGGTSAVLTLGPDAASDQLRDAMAIGIDRAILLETDGSDWDPMRHRGGARRGDPGARRRPAARSTSSCSATNRPTRAASRSGSASPTRWTARASPASRRSRSATGPSTARREAPGGWEVFEVPLPGGRRGPRGDQPAALPVGPGPAAGEEEGDRAADARSGGRRGLEMIRLVLPAEQTRTAEILGTGPDAAARVVEVIRGMGLL